MLYLVMKLMRNISNKNITTGKNTTCNITGKNKTCKKITAENRFSRKCIPERCVRTAAAILCAGMIISVSACGSENSALLATEGTQAGITFNADQGDTAVSDTQTGITFNADQGDAAVSDSRAGAADNADRESATEESQAGAGEAVMAAVQPSADDLQYETVSDSDAPVCQNPYDTLSVPTQITKIGGRYFIVDCYHSQILYHDNISDALTKWSVLTNEESSGYRLGHTIAGDGIILLADDTENNRVLVFCTADGKIQLTQIVNGVGNKPHYIVYDRKTDYFYCWSSFSGQMYLFRRSENNKSVHCAAILTFVPSENTYIRTFTISDGKLIFVSGLPIRGSADPAVTCYDLQSLLDQIPDDRGKQTAEISIQNNSSAQVKSYTVPDQIAGMVQLQPIGSMWYATISTDLSGSQEAADIVRADSLQTLSEGRYEDIYSEYFIGGGTPYYMGAMDDHWYLTEHRLQDHAIWQFDADTGGVIRNVISLY